MIKFSSALDSPADSPQVEEGRWSYRNGQYTTVTTKINGAPIDSDDPHFKDTYATISVTDRSMTYRHAGHGITFTSNRVPCDE